MTTAKFNELELTRGDTMEFRDDSAIKKTCFRLIRYRKPGKDSGTFHADWKTRHTPEEGYDEREWCRDGVFDCNDLTPVSGKNETAHALHS